MRYSIALATSRGIFSTLHSYITAVKLNSTAIKKGFDCLNIATNETIMHLNMPTSMNCT